MVARDPRQSSRYRAEVVQVVVPRRVRWLVGSITALILVLATLLVVLPQAAVPVSTLFVAAPLIAAPFLSFRATLLVGVATTGIHTVLLLYAVHEPASEEYIREANVVTVSLLALGLNYLARRGGRELATARNIAEATQRAVLPVPPARIGGLAIAARYEAAQAEAHIGGDLYAVQATPYGTRMLVGDIRGKGLDAVEALSVVVGSFRESAKREVTLSGVIGSVERALLQETRRQTEARGQESAENFMTAILAEFPDGHPDVLRIVNRGHPPPILLLPDGAVRCVEPVRYALPLGLGLEVHERMDEAREVPFPVEAKLLLYTDGISEARNGRGEFYDPESGLRGRRFADPDTLLDELVSDVKRHTGGVVQDDMALLAVEYRPIGSVTGSP